MKVLICGKGGCGKSTLSVLIAKAMKARGFSVLLVDADESNFGLYRLMGIEAPVDLMESFGGKKGFKARMNPTFPGGPAGDIFPQHLTIDDIQDKWVAAEDGIGLMVIGKIHDFGEGCACPMGVLSKKLLSCIELGADEIIIIDTEAGVEHFGRGVIAQGDLLLDIIDPTYESILLADKMTTMAKSVGIDLFYVFNKVDPQAEVFLEQRVNADRVIARIGQDNDIFLAGLEGRKLTSGLPAIEPIADLIVKYKTG